MLLVLTGNRNFITQHSRDTLLVCDLLSFNAKKRDSDEDVTVHRTYIVSFVPDYYLYGPEAIPSEMATVVSHIRISKTTFYYF
jgi:hypothetical protein